jgi:hypothetical protein
MDENGGWDKCCGLTSAGWLDNKCNFGRIWSFETRP